jgi:hypothetical protein
VSALRAGRSLTRRRLLLLISVRGGVHQGHSVSLRSDKLKKIT